MSDTSKRLPSLSVIIPCYNEEANLKRGVLDQVVVYLQKQPYKVEIIIIDDGSTDRSRELIRGVIRKNPKLMRLVENPHRGKPVALKTGVEEARNEIVLFTDMDQSTPISELEKLLPYFGQGYDLVIGSRGKLRENFPWYRQILSWGFRTGRRLVILPKISDTQCGFKSARLEVAKALFEKLSSLRTSLKEAKGWRVTAYDVELLFLAEKAGYRIAEVSVRWRDEDVASYKRRNFLKESWEMATEVIRVVINNFRGQYERA